MKVLVKNAAFVFALLLNVSVNAQTTASSIYTDTIPLGGNAWIKEPSIITDEGLTQWSEASSVAGIYFRVDVVQDFDMSLRLKVPQGKSEISMDHGKDHFVKQVSNTSFDIIHYWHTAYNKTGLC
jgi:hypothetical protein